MNKHVLALSTALSILAITPAFAQTAKVDCSIAANKADPACAAMNNSTDATTTTTTTTAKGTTAQMGSGELIVPAERLNGAQVMSASDFIGKTVYDQAGNNIGDVNDLILTGDGNVEAVILGVGGFLGIGEKDVAVNTDAIQIVQDGDNKRLVVQATKEALNNAPAYDKNNRRYADQMNGTATDTTGSTTAPAPAGTGAAVDCTLAANAADPACVNKTQQ